jgi:hypothetical protein
VSKLKQAMILFGLGATIAVVLYGAFTQEPRYKNRPLSYWVLVNGGTRRDDQYDPKYAISQIGSNALPYLLKWMKQKPNNCQIWLRASAQRYSFVGKLVPLWMMGPGIEDRARDALLALECLGPAGYCAIPELAPLAMNRTNEFLAEHATTALCNMGPNATPALLDLITNQQAITRELAIYCVGKSGNVAAIPVLLRCTHDPDTSVASSAARALGQLKTQPSTVVPVLVRLLEQPTLPTSEEPAALSNQARDLLYDTVWALGEFGTNAEAAAPELLRHLAENEDDDPLSCQFMKTLTEVTIQPEIAISALTNHLSGTNDLLRHCAALALSTMGSRAQSALPSLTNSLNFPGTRKMVALAIRRITSDASTNALMPVQGRSPGG